MAWTIHDWSPGRGAGAIVSPHYGPITFGAEANVDEVMDFQVGEVVLVELEGEPEDFRVTMVRPMFQRQPVGTHWEPFDVINGRFGDVAIEESAPGSLQLWLGDCCGRCTPEPARVRFEGVTHLHGLSEDVDFCDPLFRLASPAEIRDHEIPVPAEYPTFCIVTSRGQGPDGPPIFVVAQSAVISFPDPGSWPA